MNVSVRSYLTLGTAAATAGAIALVPPVHPLSAPPIADSARAVQLAAFDVVTPWLNLWNVSEQNAAALITQAITPPVPAVQQLVANGLTYIAMLPEFGDIADQIVANGQAALNAPFAVPANLADTMETSGSPLSHASAFPLLPVVLGDSYASLEGLFNFAATPISGVIVGLLGPVIAPLVVLQTSIQTAMDLVQATNPDFPGALNELINIPANMLNAFLNGKAADGSQLTLDLTEALGSLLPSEVTNVNLALGGLLSPAGNGPASPPNNIGAGSLFNALGLTATVELIPGFPITVTVPGVPTGPISSLLGTGQMVAQAMGWSGVGNPVQPLPASAVPTRAAVPTAAAEAAPAVADEIAVAKPTALGAGAPAAAPSAPKTGHRAPARAATAAPARDAGKAPAAARAASARPSR